MLSSIILAGKNLMVKKNKAAANAGLGPQELLLEACGAIDLGLVLYDREDRLLTCNAKYLEIYDKTSELITLGKRFEDILRAIVKRGFVVVPDGRVEEWVIERLRQHKKCKNSIELNLKCGRWLKISESRTRDGGIVGVHTDITGLKSAEKKIRSATAQLRDFAEMGSDWFWETGPDSKFTTIYDTIEELQPLTEKFTRMTRLEVMSGLNVESLIENHKADLENQRPFNNLCYWIEDSENQRRHLQVDGKPLFDGDNRFLGYRGIARDTTCEKLLETERIHTQKMEALGRMAGAITHDFNNTLQPIALLSSAIAKNLEADNPFYKEISIINIAVRQLANQTKQILEFSRKGNTRKATVNICEIVRGTIILAKYGFPENIVVTENLDPAVGEILADAAEIQSAVLNLIKNACDAYEGNSGTIDISLSKCIVDEDDISREFVKISLADQGMGIPEENLPNIFDPFYTTKSTGKGTGLGLATVYGIVTDNHDGKIEVKSKPGEGSIFQIYLPIDSK